MDKKQRNNLPPLDEARQALQRVVTSRAFSNSPRLIDFMTYVVEEQLAGRGSALKGKTIAIDVYHRDIDEAGSAQNLVRVEARRLRRTLKEYYADEGRADPLQIQLRTGSYRPRFDHLNADKQSKTTAVPEQEPGPDLQRGSVFLRPAAAVAGLVVVTLIAAASVASKRGGSGDDAKTTAPQGSVVLTALRERSIASVQAVNLAEQARGMFFPLFDIKRQEIALDSFRHAVELDPGLPEGYAGAAQVLALLSFLSDDTTQAAGLLAKAREMAERAVQLGPTDGWAQAAMGWTLAVAGDADGALRRASIAMELSPNDGHVLDLVGITALLANDPALMEKVSAPGRTRSGSGRFGSNNIWGASQLMLQNYPATIDAFAKSAERGHPVSAASLMLLATAYKESGEHEAARQTIREMAKTWPDFPAKLVSSKFFMSDPVTHARVLATLEAYITGH